jgi:23S rRNA (uracil1939-C5)-methyltransferase
MLTQIAFLDETQVEPKCPHFGVCGGCRLQNLPYSTQLELKEAQVREYLEPLDVSLSPILRCDEEWEWRNKMEFSFSQNKAAERFLGLMQRGKRGRVESLGECHIAPSWMSDILQSVRIWWEECELEAYFPLGNRGLLRTLTLREAYFTGERLALLTVSGNEKEFLEPHLESLKETLDGIESVSVRYQFVQKGTPTRFETELLSGKPSIREQLETSEGRGLSFEIDANAFFQPNSQQAQKIYQLLVEAGELQKSDVLFDLYCGTGTISLFCAPYVQKVVGIELVPEAIENAKKNAALNGIENVSFHAADVEKFLKESSELVPNVVIVDPPRCGLTKKTIISLLELGPSKILYLSCNPKSQARDLKEFIDSGYKVENCQPIDQFPQTLHIENLVTLKRQIFT